LVLHSFVGSNASFNVVKTVTSKIPASQSVEYTCYFSNLWTSSRHPTLYPQSTAKWDAPMMVSHSDIFSFWQPDTVASDGVKEMAEVSSTKHRK
jgi:hypothetical protein